MKRVIIIGGGLAGLITAIQLARKKIACTIIEKRSYPLHKVCGEYISNEVLPFLQAHDLYPHELSPSKISRFQLTSVAGKSAFIPLDLGGFSLSRFAFDHFLYEHARAAGVEFLLETTVDEISYDATRVLFSVRTGNVIHEAHLVVGAHGKRSRLDTQLDRPFMKQRSPYMAVKYHVQCDFPNDLVALHNFKGGYCGVVNVEGGITNLCYLVHRNAVRQAGSINAFEKEVLFRNHWLKDIFNSAKFVFEKPLVINEISFATKAPVEQHVLMAGDAAGMIAPLCGNGMAMAIHSAKLLGEELIAYCTAHNPSYEELEKSYTRRWKKVFAGRLQQGRLIQQLFGNHLASTLAVNLILYIKPLARTIVKHSHGEPFA